MRDHLRARVGRGPADNGLSVSARFLPHPLPFPRPRLASSSRCYCPRHGASAARMGSEAVPAPASGALSPAALGSRRAPEQRGPCVLSGASAEPFSWDGREVAASARSTSPGRLSPTVQPAWDPSRGAEPGQGFPGRSHGSQVRSSTGSEAAQSPSLGGDRGWGVLAPLHSVGGLGTPCVDPGRRAGGSDTQYRKAVNKPANMDGGPGASRPGAPDQGRRLRESLPRRPGPQG